MIPSSRNAPLAHFSTDWWRLLVEHWNDGPDRAKLAGLGRVIFKVIDIPSASMCIEFNKLGIGAILPSKPDTGSAIEGRWADWEDYIQGKFDAVNGVLRGRFVLAGGFGHLVGFADGFDQLAQVARALC